MALAGTWKKSTINPDFADPKIKAEHNFVIADIERQLSTYNLKHKSETAVVELPYLYHLKTNFVYECLSLSSFENALQLLHPTAALGIYPREKQSLIEFSEINIQKKRQQFGAPFGYFDQDAAFMLVAIRNIIWNADHIQLFAGCGVTANSIFDEEWSEILAKQDSVKKMLGL
jgi:menaquinone-specific isochorismate synthase